MATEGKNPYDRVNLVYRSGGDKEGQDIELPFRVLVLGDFSQNEAASYFDNQRPQRVNRSNFDALLASFDIQLALQVENKLIEDDSTALDINLSIQSLDAFSPQSIIDQVPLLKTIYDLYDQLQAGLDRADDSANIDLTHLDEDAIRLVQHMNMFDEGKADVQTLEHDQAFILISELHQRFNRQMDEIIHQTHFRDLESIWRSLYFLVNNMGQGENCSVEILNINKQALLEDFEDVPETIQSNLYQLVYTSEFGQFGGQPYGVLIGNYSFGPNAQDIRLMQQLAAVSAMSHAPFIAAASPALFDIDDFSGLTRLRDLNAIFSQPRFSKWVSFRESDDARYIGLTLPDFLLRPAYTGSSEGKFNYTESRKKGDSSSLWGNCAFAFASRLIDSFSNYRWCLNIAGEKDGQVAGLRIDDRGKGSRAKIPTRILISDQREAELVKHGFIPLSVRKGLDHAAFYSAHSVQKPKVFADNAEGRASTLNHLLGAQFPYLFIINRISHYLKMMQREHIGSWKNRLDMEKELNNWLKNYISDMENPTPAVRARRPLRKAQLKVRKVEGKNGWYLIKLIIIPHLKYMGESFSLSETGKLDAE